MVLSSKGITEDNCTDLNALAAIMDDWGDFRTAGATPTATRTLMKMNLNLANELHAFGKLLRIAVDTLNRRLSTELALATKVDLANAIADIKSTLQHSTASNTNRTYAQTVATSGFKNSTPKPPPQNNELKERQVFFSMKYVQHTAEINSLSASQLTQRCNNLICRLFSQDENGPISLTEPVRAISRSQAGNLTLTFKEKDTAKLARKRADEWVTLIDPDAHVPQRLYAVVAHNAPANTWDGKEDTLQDAIDGIEAFNSDAMAINFTIAKIAWLNSAEAREKPNVVPCLSASKLGNLRTRPSLTTFHSKMSSAMLAFTYPGHHNASDAKTGGIERRSAPGRCAAASAPETTKPQSTRVPTTIHAGQILDAPYRHPNARTVEATTQAGSGNARPRKQHSMHKPNEMSTKQVDMRIIPPSPLQT
jgi:hypothetical protein